MVSVNAHHLFYQLKALVLSMHTWQSSQGQPKKVTFNSYSVWPTATYKIILCLYQVAVKNKMNLNGGTLKKYMDDQQLS